MSGFEPEPDDLVIPDDASEAELLEVEEHIGEIMFSSGEVYEPDCRLCQRGLELGIWARYGVTKADLEADQ